MSETYDLEAVVKGLGEKSIGNNAQSIMSALQETNKVLSEFQKTVTMLKGMGIFPLIVRAAGKKYGVDVETPLKTDSTGIVPASSDHAYLLENINKMTKEQLAALAQKIQGK